MLNKFPQFVKDHSLNLPEHPTEETLDYNALMTALDDAPEELEDVFFYASLLATSEGWERIEEEADAQGRKLSFHTDGLGKSDLVLKAWLYRWPANQSLLEESYARARVHGKSAYTYYPSTADHRGRFKMPTDSVMAAIKSELHDYFVNLGLGKGTNVVKFDFDKEVWFLIRFPGLLTRQRAYEDDGTAMSLNFKPEEYDAVVYNTIYGDLRMNTRRRRDHLKYRVVFGHALLNTENAFRVDRGMITLEPLKGNCLGMFKTQDIEGLASIVPTRISFHHLKSPARKIVWVADKNSSLLETNTFPSRLLPEETDTVHYTEFHYRMKNRANTEPLVVHQGNTLNYERDGDSVVLEEWLRARGIVKSTFPVKKK
ncbi:MAG TPA: hypothetical protein DCZ95_07465 [Verrucomicrobia bacterium]|nr:MAG: hypothetical protein A2X46_16350 [Lentisphaerae bacterium GWF2_57_35]HBA83913.1 hypothetical protein [Verrucomicrobiota bacterium]